MAGKARTKVLKPIGVPVIQVANNGQWPTITRADTITRWSAEGMPLVQLPLPPSDTSTSTIRLAISVIQRGIMLAVIVVAAQRGYWPARNWLLAQPLTLLGAVLVLMGTWGLLGVDAAIVLAASVGAVIACATALAVAHSPLGLLQILVEIVLIVALRGLWEAGLIVLNR